MLFLLLRVNLMKSSLLGMINANSIIDSSFIDYLIIKLNICIEEV